MTHRLMPAHNGFKFGLCGGRGVSAQASYTYMRRWLFRGHAATQDLIMRLLRHANIQHLGASVVMSDRTTSASNKANSLGAIFDFRGCASENFA